MWTMHQAPTRAELRRWWTEKRDPIYTCADCGRTGASAYVQPQHPYYANGREDVARCWECLNSINDRITAQRKATLAAMPRCEFCQRRGAYRALGVLLCRAHLTLARNRLEGALGIFGMGFSATADDIRAAIRRN